MPEDEARRLMEAAGRPVPAAPSAQAAEAKPEQSASPDAARAGAEAEPNSMNA